MSAHIDIIQEGYSKRIKGNEIIYASGCQSKDNDKWQHVESAQKACGSCCLVRTSKLIVLFDTMGPWEREILIERLNSLKIHLDDIDFVIGSHGHADHIGNMNLFTKCKRQFIGHCSYFEDIYYEDCFTDCKEHSYGPSLELDDNLVLQSTPGHTNDDVSLLIKNCDKYGSIALAGDLFERAEDIEDETIWLGAGSTNPESQRHNRDIIYKWADYILPGHGPVFKTKK